MLYHIDLNALIEVQVWVGTQSMRNLKPLCVENHFGMGSEGT